MPGPRRAWWCCPTDAVAAAAAAEIARLLAAAVEARGVAHWATTGGSAAPGIYAALREAPLRDALDWSRIHTWWGDDRFVPADHPLSNVMPIAGMPIPDANLHPILAGEAIALGESPAWAAARYAAEVSALVPADPGGTPVLDLVILGVGPDGHILSVFPWSGVWDEAALVCAVPAPTHIEPHVARVTMHPRLVAAARAVVVIAPGDPRRRTWAAPGPATTSASSRSGPPGSGRRPGSWTRPPRPSCRGSDRHQRSRRQPAGTGPRPDRRPVRSRVQLLSGAPFQLRAAPTAHAASLPIVAAPATAI